MPWTWHDMLRYVWWMQTFILSQLLLKKWKWNIMNFVLARVIRYNIFHHDVNMLIVPKRLLMSLINVVSNIFYRVIFLDFKFWFLLLWNLIFFILISVLPFCLTIKFLIYRIFIPNQILKKVPYRHLILRIQILAICKNFGFCEY